MSKEKTIYDLVIGEYKRVKGTRYFRVPGGWIVTVAASEESDAACFVPLNNEFKNPLKLYEPEFKRDDVSHVIDFIENNVKDSKRYLKGIENIKEEYGNKIDIEEHLKHQETALKILKSNTK